MVFSREQLIDEFLQAAKIIICNLKSIYYEFFEQNLQKKLLFTTEWFFKNMSTLTEASILREGALKVEVQLTLNGSRNKPRCTNYFN